ncbi:MAG: hypothetical protein LBU32_28435 [Clostridiales bacterium]|nr:hypothetical protein [Clostridiales bacterium]
MNPKQGGNHLVDYGQYIGAIFKIDPGYSTQSLLNRSTAEAAFMQEPLPVADMAFAAKFNAPGALCRFLPLAVSVKASLPRPNTGQVEGMDEMRGSGKKQALRPFFRGVGWRSEAEFKYSLSL